MNNLKWAEKTDASHIPYGTCLVIDATPSPAPAPSCPNKINSVHHANLFAYLESEEVEMGKLRRTLHGN